MTKLNFSSIEGSGKKSVFRRLLKFWIKPGSMIWFMLSMMWRIRNISADAVIAAACIFKD